MNIEQVRAALASVPLEAQGSPAALFPRVIDLYLTQRIDLTCLEADGDMLLFQWGTNEWGNGPSFDVDLTRQVTLAPSEDIDDNEMIHLSCRLRYPPSAVFALLGSGNKWCYSPDDVTAFSGWLMSHPVLQMASASAPTELDLTVEHV